MPIHTPSGGTSTGRPGVLQKLLAVAADDASLTFTPLPSLGGLELVKEAERESLLRVSLHPTPEGIDSLRRTRQLVGLLSKNPFIEGSTEDSRKDAAMAKFWKAQRRNRITTKRLNYFFRHPSRMPALLAEILGSARMDLFRLLGPCPSDTDWDRFMSAKVFSSGVVQGLASNGRSKDTNAYAKLHPDSHLTTSSLCWSRFSPYAFRGYWKKLRGEQPPKVIESSRLSLQPKDAETYRVTFSEPQFNAVCQQGLSAMLSPYLQAWGITLDDQTRNSNLAKVASEIGFSERGFSTIDLASASDSVTTVLVQYLLPDGWFELLDAARTHRLNVEGEEYSSPMFSSMGNNNTFPIECLVFASLTKACIRMSGSPREWRVYGDDIIVPTGASLLLVEVLQFVGFEVNTKKSYFTGFFRESCGGNWMNGVDVTPVRLKGEISLPTERYNLFNRLQRVMPGSPLLDVLYCSFKRPLIGPAIGPEGGEDGHLVAPLHILRKACKVEWNQYIQSYKYTYFSLTPVSRKRRRSSDELRLGCCLVGDPGARHDIRGTQRYRVLARVTTTPWIACPTAPSWYHWS